MGSSKEYTNQEKADVLDACKKIGNVSKVAEQFDISRGTIYNWKGQESEIRESLAKDDVVKALKTRSDVSEDVLRHLDTYQELLNAIGDLDTRRKKMGAHVEYALADVINKLEKHPDLDEVHPKDLSKIMTDLLNAKKQLYQEPDIIIEYRNSLMERVLHVLQGEFLDEDKLRAFVDKMEAIEVEYEVL